MAFELPEFLCSLPKSLLKELLRNLGMRLGDLPPPPPATLPVGEVARSSLAEGDIPRLRLSLLLDLFLPVQDEWVVEHW